MADCSLWVASAAAGLRSWHVMGVCIHARALSAHTRDPQHALNPMPALLQSSSPQTVQGGVGVRWRCGGSRALLARWVDQ